MKFLEKDLEQIIFESHQSGSDELRKRNLYTSGKMYRQLALGGYGISDLVTVKRGYVDLFNSHYFCHEREHYATGDTNYPCLLVTLYELKKEKIGISAFLQAVGYLKGLKRFFDKRGSGIKYHIIYKIRLIGNDIDSSGNFIFLTDVFDNVEFITYEYGIDGLIFKTHKGYYLINEKI